MSEQPEDRKFSKRGRLGEGRPTKYRREFCDEVVAFCRRGYSLTAFASEIDVAPSQLKVWQHTHPEFQAAAERAKAVRLRWWEDRAMSIAFEGGTGGQSSLTQFMLKNHAPEEYRDRVEHSTTNGTALIDRNPRELSSSELISVIRATFTDEEIAERISALRQARLEGAMIDARPAALEDKTIK